MKTFRPELHGGKIVEKEVSNWSIVEVHYEGFENKKYRAVKYNELSVIIAERTFDTKESAQKYIEKQ